MSSAVVATLLAQLNDLPPAPVSSFVSSGMHLIGTALRCPDGYAVTSRRTVQADDDPLRGYRVQRIWLVGNTTLSDTQVTDALIQNPDLMVHDSRARALAEGCGRHRILHDGDPRKDPSRRDSISAWQWNLHGIVDELTAVHTVDAAHELTFSFQRLLPEAPFDAYDEELLGAIVVGVSAWARRIGFLCGLLDGRTPLSPRESDMLVQLLGPTPQKQHATALGISPSRARELVGLVHAKMGTDNRAELQRAWMSGHGDVAAPAVVQRTP